MQPDFWHERWQRNQIGFHQDQVNQHLLTFWQGLAIATGSSVFVPLCGKSGDISWLRAQGYRVLGVEISPIATQAYFDENGLQPSVSSRDGFEVYAADGVGIFCGDFFALADRHLAGVAAVYDRAALIALPPELRAGYARHMAGLLAPGARILLVTFEYPQHEMQGPPFSVTETEVRALYGNGFDIELLHDSDILDQEPRFRERGVSSLREKVYAMTYNPVFTR
jgi:thiopurine S-methyltransferase